MHKLTQAIEAIKTGDKAGARQLLSETIQAEPDNEQAWLWMSGVVDDSNQQRYCLEQVLKINPANQHAAAGLTKLNSFGNAPVPGTGAVPAASQGSGAGAAASHAGAAEAMDSKYKSLPVPDISFWPREYSTWGIWPDRAEPADGASGTPRDISLGLLIEKSGFSQARSFFWTGILMLVALVCAAIAFDSLPDYGSALIWGVVALVFVGTSLYRLAIWFMNRDLRVAVHRAGLTLTTNGESRKVLWREIARVRERWQKRSYQGVVHISTHTLEIHKTDGQKLVLDRKIKDIEGIGRIIQQAAMDHLLPDTTDRLKSGGTCTFGVYSLSRYGLTHKEKKFLPWEEVKSLTVHTVGTTTVQVNQKGGKALLPWAAENGGSVDNLHLFLALAYWFLGAVQDPAGAAALAAPKDAAQPFDGNMDHRLSITKSEARQGVQKVLYVGPPRQERRLMVQVPAGVKTGAIFRFPEYGLPNPAGGAAGELRVDILVGKGSDPAGSEATQITIGFVILLLGMMWVSFDQNIDLITSVLLAVLFGGLGGAIMAVGHRGIGILCGTLGGLVSFVLQFLYYTFMYLIFDREEFWNYEMGIVMLVSFLPGIGLYWLLTRKPSKQAGAAKGVA
jgi:hypothetical protein